MKNSIKKKLFICVAGVIATFAVVGAGLTLGKSVSADDAVIVFKGLSADYSLGDKLEIPANASVEYNGASYAAENCYLVRPDGKALSGRTFTLGSVGEYTLTFDATANGKKISASKNFKVFKDYYSVSNDTSSVCYGELNGTYKKKGMNNGVVAELTEGATLTVNEPINVYAAKSVDLFTFNLVRMDCDVNYLSIRLVDCYDPNIEIDIQYWKRINMETYLKAGPKGGGLVGLSSDDNGQYSIGGKNYSRGIFGTGTRGNRPMNGNFNNITLSFENTDDGKIRIWSNTPEHESNPDGDFRLVTEINNDKLYNVKFPGFTTGEVIMSITAKGFNNVSTARVEIGKIQGRINEELNTFGAYSDNVAPLIKVDADQTDNKIAAGTSVKVPGAKAYDASGIKGETDYIVWYNYSDPNSRRALNVSDGKFFAKELGTYTIEYRATDVYGNAAVKPFDLTAVKTADEGITFNPGEKITEAEIGSSVNLSDYSVNSLCNSCSVKIEVAAPDGTITDATSSAGSFVIEQAGNYSVTYLYSDSYYSGEYKYSFASVSGDKAVFEKREIPVPEYFIEGATYSVEDIKAYRYGASGKQAADLKAFVSYDGGEYKEISADGFEVQKASSVKLKLAVAGEESTYIESADAKVVNVGYGTIKLDVAKYFAGDFTGEAKNDYTVFTADKFGDDYLKFVNPLLVSRFSFAFAIGGGESLDGVDFILTDYYDRTKTAVISLNDGEGEAKTVAVNGVSSAIASSWKGKNFIVSCDGSSVYFDGSAATADFGFSTDLCLFTIRFRSIKKGFSFSVSALCNQPFGAQVTDDVRPMISAKLPSIVMPLNGEFTTDIPKFADVLSPSSNTCTLTVNLTGTGSSLVTVFTDATGKSVNRLAADISYDIKFTEFGCYTFTYSYTDGSGKTGNLQQLVYVYDLVAPTVRFKEEPKSVVGVSVGKEITPLEVIAEDNLTAADKLTVWTVVYDERGRLITATRGSFVLKESGRYTVYIHCKDESGNSSSVKYEVYAG